MTNEPVVYEVGDLLEVEWDDIVTFMGWEEVETLWDHVPHRCVSYGFLVKQTDYFISLCATRGRNGSTEYNQGISIPLGTIVNIRKIE